MSRKQRDQKVQRQVDVLERERVALKSARGDVERAARAWQDERQRALGVLKLICELYGDVDWSDTTPVDKVLSEHLLPALKRTERKLQASLARLVETSEFRETGFAPPLVAALPPATARRPDESPVAAPSVHRPLVTKASQGSGFGWKVNCTCGHRSGLLRTRSAALEYGRAHVAQSSPGAREEAIG